VREIVTHNKQARAFALADALGDRDLPRLLRTLDQELWAVQQEKGRSEIGLLYGLISKVRVMIFLREMLTAGWIKPTDQYARFKAQLERVPGDQFPKDKKYNPLAINPYMLFKALPHALNYTSAELVKAMGILLDCNRRLVSTGTEKTLVIQQALTRIAEKSGNGAGATGRRATVRR
jgi:DNA polymerase III delta subunit